MYAASAGHHSRASSSPMPSQSMWLRIADSTTSPCCSARYVSLDARSARTSCQRSATSARNPGSWFSRLNQGHRGLLRLDLGVLIAEIPAGGFDEPARHVLPDPVRPVAHGGVEVPERTEEQFPLVPRHRVGVPGLVHHHAAVHVAVVDLAQLHRQVVVDGGRDVDVLPPPQLRVREVRTEKGGIDVVEVPVDVIHLRGRDSGAVVLVLRLADAHPTTVGTHQDVVVGGLPVIPLEQVPTGDLRRLVVSAVPIVLELVDRNAAGVDHDTFDEHVGTQEGAVDVEVDGNSGGRPRQPFELRTQIHGGRGAQQGVRTHWRGGSTTGSRQGRTGPARSRG